jgi:hypothetical protein
MIGKGVGVPKYGGAPLLHACYVALDTQ